MVKRPIFYGWYVVAISFAIMTIAYGVYYSWPVFYVVILAEFGWSRAATASIFSAASIVYGLASPVSGYLFDRFGPRRLFIGAAIALAVGTAGASQSFTIPQFSIFYGIFVAAGTICAGFVPNAVLISNWFDRRRGTALGIAQAGTRDAYLLSPIVQLAILALGWRNSYMVLAVAALMIIPLSLLLRTRPQDKGLLPDGADAARETAGRSARQSEVDRLIVDRAWTATEWTVSKATKTLPFWALSGIMFGTGFGYTALISHFVALITDMGFSSVFAASLLAIYAVTAMIGRGLGFISDFTGREVAFTLSMALTLLALLLLFAAKYTSAGWILYAFMVSFGLGNGMFSPAYTAVASDLFQGKRFGTIIGLANLGYGIAAGIAIWLYGYIFDVTGGYSLALVITMLAVVLMTIGMWVAAPRRVRRVAGWRPKT